MVNGFSLLFFFHSIPTKGGRGEGKGGVHIYTNVQKGSIYISTVTYLQQR